MRADSREVIKRVPDNSIDLIFTDPPYNIGKYSTGNIKLPGRSDINNDVAEWDLVDFNPEEWADDFVRILKPTGNLFIFTSYNQLGRWYDCLNHRFDSSNFVIWHKTNPTPKIFKSGFLNSCEMIFTCWNKAHTWNFISQEEMHNFIESPICMRPERLISPKHPAQKPLSILRKVIKIASSENDIVFDPFMGVGSVGVAALEMKRRYIGIEIDEVYCQAARKRIDDTFMNLHNEYVRMKIEDNVSNDKAVEADMVCEPLPNLLETTERELSHFPYRTPNVKLGVLKIKETELSPIIKWPGGKEKELKYIIPNIPEFERFFEPFVGGGSVFMGIKADKYYINDLSTELIDLYRNISSCDSSFFQYVEQMDNAWQKALAFLNRNTILIETYIGYRKGLIGKIELKEFLHIFCANNRTDILALIPSSFETLNSVLLDEMEVNLYRKMIRMHEIEQNKHLLSDDDLKDNIEAAIKSAVYMCFRHLYNSIEISKKQQTLHTALFFFLRNYAYSGMFRYSQKGDFNVPYGGIAYNRKLMNKKLVYYKSSEFLEHFKHTTIYNLDFENFLRITQPTSQDFVFLDPPYDSEFSTYAQNDFTKEDQVRLANYMINECKAKWMLIIKNTEFIYQLYDKDGIKIQSFNKEYKVSFMNRNNKHVTHLLITNY